MAEKIFICGAPRSGTSIMMRLCRMLFPEHESFDEGHVLDVISPLMRCIDRFLDGPKAPCMEFTDMAVAHVDRKAMKAFVANGLSAYYASLYKSNRFIDKTHGQMMIRGLPQVLDCHPTAKIIFLRRRPLEYMRSAMLKFANFSFDENLAVWTESMEAWLAVRGDLKMRAIEIEHFDLAFRRQKAAEAICSHLGFGEDKVRLIVNFLDETYIEKTDGLTYDPISLGDLALDDEAARRFVNQTRTLCATFGYSFDGRYFADRRPLARHRRTGQETRQ